MTTITYSGGSATEGFDYFEWNIGLLMSIVQLTFSTSRSANHVTYNEPVLGTLTAFGTFSNYDANGDPQSGTVTGLTHTTTFGNPSAITIAITGISIPVPTLFNWIATNNAGALESTLFGGADTFNGANNGERIFGYDGNDAIHGNDGDDTLIGGNGNDTLNGGAGWDTLDSAGTTEGDDTLNGGDGNDIIWSGGVDVIDGGAGVDLVNVTFTTTVNLSTNDLFAPGGFTLANGTTIQNVEVFALTAGAGGDTLTIITPGLSGSSFNGGGGIDILISDQSANSASQTLIASGTPLALYGEFAGYRLYDVERYIVTTGAGNDSLTGGSGDDVLNAGAGNDSLIGAAGANTLNGGDGNDYIESAGVGDQIDGGTGVDILAISRTSGAVSFSIASLASGVTFSDGTSLTNIEGIVLTTGAGNDTFNATGLSTTSGFFAGAGTDRLIYDHTGLSTALRVQPTAGSFNNGVANFTFASVEEFYITGGSGDDILIGDAAGDVLIGGGGSDSLSGNQGNDSLSGGEGNDFISGGEGANTLLGQGGDDQITSLSATDVIDGGAGADRIVLNRSNVSGTFNVDAILNGTLPDGTTISNMESFDLNLGNGADTIVVTAVQGVTNAVNAGSATNDHLIADLSAYTTGVSLGILDSGGRNFSLGVASGGAIMLNGIDSVTFQGGSATDFITGSVGDDILSGNGGDDFITGRAGVNVLNGGGGSDSLSGNWTDTFDGGDGVDRVVIETTPASQTGIDYNAVAMASSTGQVLADGGVIRNVESIDMAAGNGDDTMQFVGLTGLNRFIGAGGFDRITVDLSATSVAITSGVVDLSGGSFSLTFSAELVTILGGSGNDSLGGTFGVDTYFGNGGNDTLGGFEGDDALNGGIGNDTLFGGAGADTMIGGDGADILHGGGETDTASYVGSNAGVIVQMDGSAGIGGHAQGDTLTAIENLTGSAFDDTLIGDDGTNVFSGGAGDDILRGAAGADALNGGDGTDTASYEVAVAGVVALLAAAAANAGEAAGDTYASIENLIGSANNDTLGGNAAANLLDGGAGADAMSGGAGDDTYVVDNAGDAIGEAAGEGADSVQASVTYTLAANLENLALMGSANLIGTGNGGANSVAGNSGNNVLDGADGNDVLFGLGGNDTLVGGFGADTMAGGLGDDVHYVDSNFDTVTELFGEGYDWIFATVSLNLPANIEGQVLLEAAGQINAGGNAADNYMQGNSFDNGLDGGAGTDSLFGLGGNDVLFGGGLDNLFGGTGNDVYIVDNPGTNITELAGEGYDWVFTTTSYNLPGHVDGMVLDASAGQINAGGNAADNYIQGNDADNGLDGGAGTDTLVGLGGNDTLFGGGLDNLIGGIGNDVYIVDNPGTNITELSGEGYDWIFTTSSFTMQAHVDGMVLEAAGGAINAAGNAQNNYIQGNSFNNGIDGGAGADTLVGFGGDDTFVFQAGQANGDVINDFIGNGVGAGDRLIFQGYGTAAQGASFTQLNASQWQITSANGLITDILTLANGAAIDPSDYFFGP